MPRSLDLQAINEQLDYLAACTRPRSLGESEEPPAQGGSSRSSGSSTPPRDSAKPARPAQRSQQAPAQKATPQQKKRLVKAALKATTPKRLKPTGKMRGPGGAQKAVMGRGLADRLAKVSAGARPRPAVRTKNSLG